MLLSLYFQIKFFIFFPGQEGQEDITLLAVKLATSFFLESFIHAKEKLNIVQWVELLTKQFDSSTTACSWFLSHMAADNTWAVTIFLKCHVNTIRQMFHRLCIHVIQKLRDMEKSNYLLPWIATDPHELPDEKIRPQVYYLFFYSSPKSTLLFQYSTGPPERISKWLGLIF